VLPIDDGLEQAVHDSFWEMVAALGSDQPPAWAPALVKESALAVLEAFDHAAGHVRVTSPDRAPIEIVPRRADRAVWSTRGVPADRTVELVGRLEAVDLRSTRFRLRDAAGNAIALHHVVDAERAAALVGQRALATGEAIVGDAGQVVGVEAPTLVAAPLPESWTTPVDADYEAIIGAAPGPDPDGGVEFTDEEFAEFLAATDH
jgi:hypothetical protein